MTQGEDDRIRRLYTMDNLPVSWCVDSDLGAGTVAYQRVFFQRNSIAFGWLWAEFKKSGIGRGRRL